MPAKMLRAFFKIVPVLFLTLLAVPWAGMADNSADGAANSAPAGCAGPASQGMGSTCPAAQRFPFSPGRLIVRFHPGVQISQQLGGLPTSGRASLDSLLAEHGVQSSTPLFGHLPSSDPLSRVQLLSLGQDSDLPAAVAAFVQDPNVEWAEPDYLAHAAFLPNDPHYPDQWGLARVHADQAWDVTQGSPAVAIAVVDTGIDLNHPDLASNLWINPGEVPGNGQDDDGNGKVDDVNGWDWVNNDSDPQDDIGHGTHVAGIAAAATNNGLGVAGTCPSCRLMALKVLDAGGTGTYSDIAAGILYAADKGAKVINLSLGGYADSSLLRDAVAYASQHAVVVAAAGNDNRQDPFYPAAYDEYVLAVAATDNNDQKAAFANYGSWVDLAAPGVNIWSTLLDDTYAAWSGSSMAAPFVSGVAGLVRSQHPDWSSGAGRAQLVHTADSIDAVNPGFEGLLGAGRLNAYQSVTVIGQPEVVLESYVANGVTSGNPQPGQNVNLALALHNHWLDAVGVTGSLVTSDPYVTITDNSASWGNIHGFETFTNTVDLFAFSVLPATPYNHTLQFQVNLSANDGAYVTTIDLSIQVANNVTHLSGVINSDMTLTPDRVYVMDSSVLVNTGVTVTVQPGTTVQFGGHYILDVRGTLVAIGTPDQLIRFTSAQASPQPGDWGSIVFHESPDAVYDAAGNYVSGSALAYAEIEYGGTIMLYYSQPYFAHNHIHDNIADWAPIAEYPWDTGVVTYYPAASIGYTLHDNVIENNQGGGIKAEHGLITITHNIIQNNTSGSYGGGITCLHGECRILENRILGNVGQSFTGAIFSYGAKMEVSGNLIANNVGPQEMSDRGGSVFSKWGNTFEVISNTITNNTAFAALLLQRTEPDDRFQENNIIGNTGDYVVYLYDNAVQDLAAAGNYWGTLENSQIDAWIWDFQDDFDLGEVHYLPIAAGPIPGTPPFLWKATTDPESPVSQGPVTIQLDFSAPMTTTVQPTVTFGISVPYGTHVVPGDWISPTRWEGVYDVTYYTGDGLQHVRVAGAVGDGDGMELPEDTHFTFEIATIGAVNINAEPGYGYVDLSWPASDLATAAGYNLYRSTQSGGPYTRLNNTLLTTLAYRDTAVSNGTTYYYLVRLLTTDLYELDYGDELGATPNDYSPPARPAVTDDGTCTPYTDQLHATWSSSDPESGIAEYQYSIGTWTGGTDVISWTSAGASGEITRTGLALTAGVTYYLNAKARNGAGAWSPVGSSDGILVSSGCPAVDFVATPRSGALPLQVQFTDQTLGTVVSRLWDFGDGASSDVANPAHTYLTTGSFTVTLTVVGTTDTNSRYKPSYITVWEKHTVYLPLVLRGH